MFFLNTVHGFTFEGIMEDSPKRVSFNNNVNTLERIMGTNILPPETFAVTTQLQLKHCLLEL